MNWLVITRSDSDVTSLLIFPTRGSVHLPTPAGMWAGRLTANTDVLKRFRWLSPGCGQIGAMVAFIVILVLIWFVALKLLAFELSKTACFLRVPSRPPGSVGSSGLLFITCGNKVRVICGGRRPGPRRVFLGCFDSVA